MNVFIGYGPSLPGLSVQFESCVTSWLDQSPFFEYGRRVEIGGIVYAPLHGSIGRQSIEDLKTTECVLSGSGLPMPMLFGSMIANVRIVEGNLLAFGGVSQAIEIKPSAHGEEYIDGIFSLSASRVLVYVPGALDILLYLHEMGGSTTIHEIEAEDTIGIDGDHLHAIVELCRAGLVDFSASVVKLSHLGALTVGRLLSKSDVVV